MMNVLDLFSGIGGFSLGLERTGGFRTVAFCEIDPYCRKVLAEHWPNVPVLGDVRAVNRESLAANLVDPNCDNGGARRSWRPNPASKGQCLTERPLSIDVICGGFPCQDISVAGKGAGLAGSRSGLWKEYARIIGELRPRYVIVENVSALLGRGLGDVLGDLAALGYDAEWHCIPASAVGAPHRRDRIWIVAHPGYCQSQECKGNDSIYQQRPAQRRRQQQSARIGAGGRIGSGDHSERTADDRTIAAKDAKDVANAVGTGLEGCAVIAGYIAKQLAAIKRGGEISDSNGANGEALPFGGADEGGTTRSGHWWLVEPDMGRVAHGVPARVDRLKALGNAVVPQIPEIIGRAILAAEVQP